MSSKKKSITKEALIEDLLRVANEAKVSETITRNYYRAAAKYPESAWQKHFSTFEEFANAAGINGVGTVSEIQGNQWNVFLPKTEFCSADEVIKFCNVDLSIWELDRFRAKDVTKGDDDVAKFQISAFFKRKINEGLVRKEIAELKKLAKESVNKAPGKPSPVKFTGNLLEIGIPDLHMGKLAWPTETGHEPYDVQIAEATFNRALDTLIDRSKAYEIEEVLFTVGNDLLNSDNAENQTTGGTTVTTDVRYHKTYWKTRNLMISAIEKLRKIAKVRVLVCPGNHDTLAAFHLGDSLECYFHKDKDVVVENSPTTRKYVEWGSVMLMFCHGHEGNRSDYALQMATEQPEMFGRTKFREVHTGHTHQTKLDEKFGVRVRVLPALCPPDDWHAAKGFTGNLRNAEAYVWSKTEGLVNIAVYNDNAQTPITTKRTIVK